MAGKARAAAKTVIDASCEDPAFWSNLLQQSPEVSLFLRRSLQAKALKDCSFAKHVVAANPAKPLVPLSKRCFSEVEVVETIASPKRRRLTEKQPPFKFINPIAPTARLIANLVSPNLWNPCQGLWRCLNSSSDSVPSTPSSPSEALEACSRQSHAASLGRENFLPIGIEVNALVLRCLTLKERIGLVPVSRSSKRTFENRSCWDPLHLGRLDCKALLRHLKEHDPFSCFASDVHRTKSSLPGGLFQVTKMTAELMDPERVELEQSDTEDEAPKPRPLVVADPLDEMCKRLRYYFTKVKEISLTNIEDYRMDYRFVGLRTGSLAEYGFVELTHCATVPPTYALRAVQDEPPRILDIQAALSENRSRLPQGVSYIETTTISEREALYLAEHRSAYKNGDDFHLIHAFYRTVRSHSVRKRYKSVVATLRDRFPQLFGSVSLADSPRPSTEASSNLHWLKSSARRESSGSQSSQDGPIVAE